MGIYQLSIDGVAQGVAQDMYAATGTGVFVIANLGPVTFATAGNHTFRFTITGRNASATSFRIMLDTITLTP